MRIRPSSREQLIAGVAETAMDLADGRRARVAIDAAEALQPDSWAADVVTVLRSLGRYALHVSVRDFLLPASQRLEFGRTNPDAFYEGWRDENALRREVLEPAAADGTGRVLPALWRTDIDRSARADYVDVPTGGVIVVSGEFLLGGSLAFEYAIHLDCSSQALQRRTPPEFAWTLPAYARYDQEVAPSTIADLVVRLEDPRRPAVVEGL
ncbi:MAG TPA: uridine kinase [Micromonosporaceae bacterium]|nr:uridine kinase [Micromonosporaceae bacterium]